MNLNDTIAPVVESVAFANSTKVLNKENRKAENEECIALMTSDSATNGVDRICETELYNPKLYKARVKTGLADE